MTTQTQINNLAYKIVGGAIEVHKNLGPGLLESIYETCLLDELREMGLQIKSQVYVPIIYKNKDLGGHLKLDILVNEKEEDSQKKLSLHHIVNSLTLNKTLKIIQLCTENCKNG